MGRRNVRGGHEFCCCAIPYINVGGYVVVLEIALVAFLVGILALAPSAIVAGLGIMPSYAKAIVAALAFVTFVWQIVGLLAIKMEKTKLYHLYVRITTLLTLSILAATIAFYVVSAVQHDTAATTCTATYGAVPTTSTTVSGGDTSYAEDFGSQICDYFVWAQIGAMGGLIVLMGLVQLYMCFAARAYGRAQRQASRDYKATRGLEGQTMGAAAGGYSSSRAGMGEDEIPLASRNLGSGQSEVWDTRDEAYYPQNGPAHATGNVGSNRDSAATLGGNGGILKNSNYDNTAPGYSNDSQWDASAHGTGNGYPAYTGRPGDQAYPAYPAYESR